MSDKQYPIEIIIYPVKAAAPKETAAPVPAAAAVQVPHRPPARLPKVKSDLGLQGIRIALIMLLVIAVAFFAHQMTNTDDKTVAAKKEDPKNEETKKDEPKKEEPKKEEPGKEEVKVDPPPPVEPKKEEPKKEEPKKEEPKKEEPGVPEKLPDPPPVEPKKEEPPKPDPKEVEFARLVEESTKLLTTDRVASLDCALKAVEIHPERADLWKRIGDLQHQGGSRDKAAEAWTKSIALEPSQPGVLNNLGVYELQAGRLDMAQQRLEAALKLAPSSSACHNLGNLYLAKNELSKASHHYRRAIELEPTNVSARFNLGLVLEKQGKAAEAAGVLASIGPDMPEAARHRARIEAGLGGAAAQRALDEARKSKDAALVQAVSEGFRKAGEMEKSLALMDRVVDLLPQDAKPLMNRGAIRHQMAHLDEAAADYEAAIKLDPKLALAHYNLGLLAEEKKQYIAALEHYAGALKIDSKMAAAHNNIGVLYLKVSQPAKAIDCFKKAVEADPSFAAGHLNLGWAMMSQGANDKALAEFKAYASLVPLDQLDPEVVKAMARLQEK